MQNLPQEVGRDIVAYGDSRYLRLMPLRTQQYRIHIRYACPCSIKLTTYPRCVFRFRMNKRMSTTANLFAKSRFQIVHKNNFMTVIDNVLSNTRLKDAKKEKLILDKITDNLLLDIYVTLNN